MEFRSDRVTSSTRSRFDRPPNPKRWYRCRCGRWHGINKKFMCWCGAFPKSGGGTAKQQAESDRRRVRILESLGHHQWADLVRRFLP